MRPIMDIISFLKKEIDKIPKCIFVIVLSLFFDWSLSAQTYNVSYQNSPLSEILLDLSKQYNIKVAFDHEKASSIYINKTISESSVEALLKKLLQETDLTYEYRYNHYLIHDINKKQSSAICQIVGVVSDEESGEALPYANVIILNDFSYAITSSNGLFSIKGVKVNPIHLNISYIGYEQLDTTIKWTDANIKLDLKLKRNPYQLASIVINGRNNEVIDMRNNGNVSIAINTQKLIDLPTVTETDVFRALQLLPGVNYFENSTGISIRGSSSDQNLILFDGQTIYNLSHYYGFVSALNPNVIKDVQIYKGGYDVQYGERVSGIIDITSKNGDKEKAKVYGDLNLLSANLTTEIPINEKISMIAAVRRSYSDIYATELAENMSKKSMSQFINDPSTIVNITKPSYYFYDYNFKMTIRPKKYETFLLNSYGGKDYYKNVYNGSLNDILISGDDKEIWKNYGFSGSWQRQWNESLYSDTQIGTSGYYDESNSLSRIDKTNSPEYLSDYLPFSINDFGKTGYNDIRDFHISSKFQYQISNNNQLDFGAIIRYTDIKYKKSTSNQLSYDDIHFAGNIASVYAQDKIDIKGSRIAELAKALFSTPNYLLGFEGVKDEAQRMDEGIEAMLGRIQDDKIKKMLMIQIEAV
ncbi:MAG: TonB-dependent receptor plug domain-containing protein, partial [Bacteroidales bacterium]|nr:TonB-dependent receptor plug domain-containing protein [Bacteroidales bacterium]